MTNRIRQLAAVGQAIWLDFISRDLLRSGKLAELVEEGILGMTSNPTIFQKAIAGSTIYDADIRPLDRAGHSTYEIYETLALADIAAAADILHPAYNETHGRDGFVSIEVNPGLAHDTAGTIAEALRLFDALHRPNIMIKVPATEAGLPAITALIGAGVNVNVTLIFSISLYERVMQAYLDGLAKYKQTGRPMWLVSSVASFFVSRVDTLVDQLLNARIDAGEEHLEELLGRAAVANAKIAYSRYKAVFEGHAFEPFRTSGARPQRPLWASTSTKNPAYPDTLYVDPLIGVNTVNTAPPQTLDAIRDHAIVAQTVERELEQAFGLMNRLREIGIDFNQVTDQLLAEGVKLFADSFDKLMTDIDAKREAIAQPA